MKITIVTEVFSDGDTGLWIRKGKSVWKAFTKPDAMIAYDKDTKWYSLEFFNPKFRGVGYDNRSIEKLLQRAITKITE